LPAFDGAVEPRTRRGSTARPDAGSQSLDAISAASSLDAPAVKRVATAAYGGEVVLYDRDAEDREAIGQRLARAA